MMRLLPRRVVTPVLAALVALSGVAATTVNAAPAAAATIADCSKQAAPPTIRYGDDGACVTYAQKLLVGAAVLHDTPNGRFGPATLAATKTVQKDNAIAADGVIGPVTWRVLRTPYDKYKGPNRSKRVVLTYDDCPRSVAAFKAMVEAAHTLNIGMVLAPTGTCINDYKGRKFDLVDFARKNGQHVINHSNTHPNLTKLSKSQVIAQLGAPGVQSNYGRPPFGARNATVDAAYQAKGMRQWFWTVDTNDWRQGKTTREIVAYAVANSKAGDTVLMHMQHGGFNPAALKRIKDGLKAKGLEVCRASAKKTPVRMPTSIAC